MKADYDQIAEQWIAARTRLPPRDRELFERFCAALPPGAAVLDFGCGAGVPMARELAERGFAVTGVDRSAKLLAAARAAVPGATFHRAEFDAFELAEGAYSGIVFWDALFHLPRAEHVPLLRRLHAALAPGGHLLLTSGGCDDAIPAFTDFMYEVEFFYDAYPPAELRRHCAALGFCVVDDVLLNTPDGARDKGRLGLLLARG
jgi:SAM-dependent methyltransferase